ncbi:MAG: choice-of-anchor L domain-containing protein [Myxococcota bacterium]
MRSRVGLSVLLLAVGCADEGREDSGTASGANQLTTISDGASDSSPITDGDDDDAETGDEEERLDIGNGNSGGNADCQEGQDCPDTCEASTHVPCDDGTTDLFAAMGLGCPGDPEVTTSVMGSLQSMGVRTSFGPTDTWAPREGSSFAVIGSGRIADLDLETPALDLNLSPTHCNDDVGEFSPGATLPPPLQIIDVAGDCTTDDSLLGTGDCSNSIAAQFNQGGSANDYAEIRVEATVPVGNNSISYDFAFFSTEYPEYFGSGFNDMYVGWLESESWTGNISFDEQGNPISLNAGFLDFRDDAGSLPEFGGTCMKQHAGTKWLSTTAPVTPGEDIVLVLAIFDLSDAILDSYVFLDNFDWGCDGTDAPTTTPVG